MGVQQSSQVPQEAFQSKREFVTIKRLGSGGFGKVNLVRHIATNKEYVLKVVNLTTIMIKFNSQRQAEKAIEMSRTEHEKMMQFDHPNIVKAFGGFESVSGSSKGDHVLKGSQLYYLVVEYCDGGDLDRAITQACESFTELQLLIWARQTVSAIRYLHERRMVHRDIKPKNVFLTGGDFKIVKLGDFGLAKNIDTQTANSSGTSLATYEYASPEYCRGYPYDFPNDIWALGVTMYELTTFKMPFYGAGMAVITAVLTDDPTPIPAKLSYSSEYKRFVMLMMNKNPEQRPTAVQLDEDPIFHRALEEIIEQLVSDYASRLHAAAKNGDLEAIKTMVGEIRLKLTSFPTHLSLLAPLIEHRNDEEGHRKNTPLLEAIIGGYFDVVEFLVKELGADVYARDDSESQSLAIHRAAGYGDLQIVQLLLEAKPDLLEMRDSSEDTPLCVAALKGKLDVVRYLCAEKGANVEAKAVQGRTALHNAAEKGHAAVVRCLVEVGNADICAKETEYEAMPIHLAAEYGQLSVVEYILAVRPDLLEVKMKNNHTPLCRAALRGQIDVVKFLCDVKGANVEARSKNGRTPLHLASERGHWLVVQHLIEKANADVYAKTNEEVGTMAIHLAAQFGHTLLVEYLLDMRPDLVDAKSNSGMTAIGYAKQFSKSDTFQFLKQRGSRYSSCP